jgi:hypothetical protein
MIRVRRSLGPIAAAWLFCQAMTMGLVPIQLDASLAACVCADGASATCPMHHKTPAGSTVCVMQSAAASVALALHSLFSVAGLVPALPQAIVPAPAARAVEFEPASLTQRLTSPDSPPPRT